MLADEDGVVLLVAVRDRLAGAVGLRVAAQPEVGARGCQRQEVNGRAGVSGCDAEGAVGVVLQVGGHAEAGQGGGQGNEGQKRGDLHCNEWCIDR